MSTVTINGRTYSGHSVSIINGQVTIDGVIQAGDKLSGVVELRVLEGVLGELRTDASVSAGRISGSVTAGGSVSCEDVGSNVSAGGSVSCGKVGGSVSAGGSVSHC
jgi:hypothetical protein